MASDQEAWAKRKAWESKSLTEIRGELVRAEGKHQRLCNEASRRLAELANKIDQIRLIAVSDGSPQERIAHIISKIDGIIGG